VFLLYISIRELRKGPGKFLSGVLEKSWIFFPVKEWEPCIGLLKTLNFVNFGGFRGFRFLDPPGASGVRRRGLTKRRWADSRTTGQGNCSDWPVGVVQTTTPSLPCLDVGKICIYCTKAYVDYYHT